MVTTVEYTRSNYFLVKLFFTFIFICSSNLTWAQNLEKSLYTEYREYINPSLQKVASSANDYIGFYQKYISGVKGNHCPMYPSCSRYGLKVFNERNFVEAFILESDRLMRCGHDHDNYSVTLRSNGLRFIDYPYYDPAPDTLLYRGNQYFFAYGDGSKDDSTKSFIKTLINNEYYDKALLEILRIQFYEDTLDKELYINKFICLKALGKYEKAIYEYSTDTPEDYKTDPALLYQVALMHYYLKNYNSALEYDSLAIVNCHGCDEKPKLDALNGLLYAYLHQWTNSQKSYNNSFELKTNPALAHKKIEIAEKAHNLKTKNPTTAGLLSMVPGAGYAYSGHWQTGLTSLVINGLLAYATYTSIKSENYGVAALTGIFNLSFYIGNIQGSIKSAKRYNAKQRQDIINKLNYYTSF